MESLIITIGAPFATLVAGARGSVTSYRSKIGAKPPLTVEPTPSPTPIPFVFESKPMDTWRGTEERIVGNAVSLSSDGLVFAYSSLNKGSVGFVNVYTLDGSDWNSLGQVSDDEIGADFGHATSLSGDGRILAVGMPKSKNGTMYGKVRVFQYEERLKLWSQLGSDIVALCNGDTVPVNVYFPACDDDDYLLDVQPEFGYSVSLSEDGFVLAVGAPTGYRSQGNTDVYRLDNGQWQKMGGSIVNLERDSGKLGWAVSLSSNGMRVAIGAPFNERIADESGAGRIYEFIDGTWEHLGQELLGEGRHNLFGSSISLSGDGNVAAIGSVNNDNEGGEGAGHVRIYTYQPTTNWTQVGKTIIGKASDDRFGSAVSLSKDGKMIAVGANLGGYVRVYEYDNDNTYWHELGAAVEAGAKGGGFGAGVAFAEVAGKLTLAVGAPLATAALGLGQTVALVGEVYVFEGIISS
jgi:hypothetical protein